MSRPSFPDSASNPFSRFLTAVLRALFVLGALALTILLLLAVAVVVIVSLLAGQRPLAAQPQPASRHALRRRAGHCLA